MTIASEITDLQTNLAAAKSAVVAKGGTTGDTGLAGLASEIASIPAGGVEPGGEATITGYDTSTGVISGSAFGTTAGTVYLLDRNTHTYVSQATSSWSGTSITLTTPIDTSVIEGDTSLVVVTNAGEWSSKWLITGDITVTGYVKAYVKNPDTGVVRTVAVDSSEWSQFAAPGVSSYAWQIIADGDTFYADEVVGIQFGSSFDDTSFGTRTLLNCSAFNQPLTIPNTVTSIGTYFLGGCAEFNQPLILPNTVTAIGSNFLSGCAEFNQPLTIPNITTIGNYFMGYCRAFNQPLTIPSTVTSIGTYFLTYCAEFNQPLAINSGVTTIGNYFLASCSAFNQPLTISNTVTSIGTYFLANCSAFNQPLTISNTVTAISDYFLQNCPAFNQPLTIPNTVTSIGATFLNSCYAFNQLLTIPNTVTTIGNYFLQNCSAFNQPLTIPNTVTTIGNNFLQNCYAFNQPLTIPSTVASIGTNFLNGCYAFSSLIANTTTSPTDNNSLASNSNIVKMYVKGITVTGIGTATWLTNLPNRTSSPYRNLIDGTA